MGYVCEHVGVGMRADRVVMINEMVDRSKFHVM